MKRKDWVSERVEQVRDARKRQGHDLSHLEEGIVEAVAKYDPAHNQSSRGELEQIRSAIAGYGRWESDDEWRISIWFHSAITPATHGEAAGFELAVECDAQKFSCFSPTLESAYDFMRLYQAIIIDQFYTIGPPWAGGGVSKPYPRSANISLTIGCKCGP